LTIVCRARSRRHRAKFVVRAGKRWYIDGA
jgi:hypothetical protein